MLSRSSGERTPMSAKTLATSAYPGIGVLDWSAVGRWLTRLTRTIATVLSVVKRPSARYCWWRNYRRPSFGVLRMSVPVQCGRVGSGEQVPRLPLDDQLTVGG